MDKWRSKIVGLEEVAPEQLLANPSNARRHSGTQRDMIRSSLDALGWVAPVIVNRRTNRLVDGHARVEEAISAGVELIPVVAIDISPEDEALMLATYDPIGLLANYDADTLIALANDVGTVEAPLQRLIDDLLGAEVGGYRTIGLPEGGFQEVPLDGPETFKVLLELPVTQKSDWHSIWQAAAGASHLEKSVSILQRLESSL